MATGSETVPPKSAPPMASGIVHLIGWYLIIIFFLQIALLIEFWPDVVENTSRWKRTYFGWSSCGTFCTISDDGRLLVLVLLAGGAGAVTHALRSFGARLGNGSLNAGWGWWYALRPFEGAVIALAFYLTIRGGLMGTNGSGGGSASVVSPYATTGISVLVGMFSQQAMAKLKDVAETFFRKPDPDPKPDKPEPPAPPTITEVRPASLKAGSASADLAITGTGFAEGTQARVNGQARPTARPSDTALTVTLTAEDLKERGVLKITVLAPGGGESKPVEVRVE